MDEFYKELYAKEKKKLAEGGTSKGPEETATVGIVLCFVAMLFVTPLWMHVSVSSLGAKFRPRGTQEEEGPLGCRGQRLEWWPRTNQEKRYFVP